MSEFNYSKMLNNAIKKYKQEHSSRRAISFVEDFLKNEGLLEKITPVEFTNYLEIEGCKIDLRRGIIECPQAQLPAYIQKEKTSKEESKEEKTISEEK